MSRILIIAYTHYFRDGRVRRHAEALAGRGDQVDVISLDHGDSGNHGGVNIVGLKIARYRGASRARYLWSYLEFFARAARTALRLNSQGRYDVAIVCTMPDAAIVSALPLRLFGSRLVLDVHDTMPELYLDKFGGRRGALGAKLLMLEERLCAALVDRVLAVHQPHAERLIAAGVAAHKIRVVTNSPDTAVFTKFKARTPEQQVTIVCHGTITNRLGLDIALEALSLLRGQVPDLRLEIIGEGDHLEEIKAMTKRLNLRDIVTFKPPVSIDVLPTLLRNAAIGLVPNRPTEATHLMLPVKLLEYISLGIPVICARLRTVEHYFPEESLQYFEAGNASQLAHAIKMLYQQPLRRSALAGRAAQILRNLSWENERHHLFEAIDSLLPGNGQGRGGNPLEVSGPGENDQPIASTSGKVRV